MMFFLLLLVGSASGLKCPRGLRSFATRQEDTYYECVPGEEAVLKTCQNGEKYDKSSGECSLEVAERGVGKHERVSMGEAITIGSLYDVRKGVLYNGFNLWTDKTLAEQTSLVTDAPTATLEYLTEQTSRSKADHFGIGAELELDFLSGLIKIKGSANYLRDEKKTRQAARVVMKGQITGRVESFNIRTPVEHRDVCKLVNPRSGPTHVIVRVTRGQRSFFVFDKQVSKDEKSEAVEGSLEASMKSIPGFSVEGKVVVRMNGTTVKNLDRLSVKFYGDAILSSFPTTYPQAAIAYQETVNVANAPMNTPLKYNLVPISQFCDGSGAGVILDKISNSLVEQASSSLSTLKGIQLSVNTLIGSDPAIRYLAIRKPLVTFKASLDKFVATYKAKLSDLLPKVRSREAEERSLVALLNEFDESPFQESRCEAFLANRNKEISAISIILENTLKNSAMTLADVSNARDNECIFRGEQATSFILKILPAEDIAESFLSKTGVWKESTSTWFRNIRFVKSIGEQNKNYEGFVETNFQDKSKLQCFLTQLVPVQSNSNYDVKIFAKGHEVAAGFSAPRAPPTPTCSADKVAHDRITLNSRAKTDTSNHVTGHEVLIETLNKQGEFVKSSVVLPNQDKLVITGLEPLTQYRFSTRYVIENGHAHSAQTPWVDSCVTRPSSPPVALKTTAQTDTSLSLTWAKPDVIPSVLAGKPIRYTIKVFAGSSVARTASTTALELEVKGLKANTKYTVKISAKIDHASATVPSLWASAEVSTAIPRIRSPQDLSLGNHRAEMTVVVQAAGLRAEFVWLRYYPDGGDAKVLILRTPVSFKNNYTIINSNFLIL